ncbi:MAG: glutathione peroxidase [Chloroflexi bacterium]|nr:glutathione peroxidase [Anaerolineaceae bacterium]NMB90821.1 glutathione peroxidase [Chloroflexota bacterium]
MSIYDFNVNDAAGESHSLDEYRGKVMLIVNTASKCGFTPQYAELQSLYTGWRDKGLEILAFPCDQFAHQEPGSDAEIQEFCQVNYGVTFPVFAKIDVNGENAHPLYRYLRAEQKGMLGDGIKWNFTKFLVDQDGRVIARYAPTVDPGQIVPDIAQLLDAAVEDQAEAAGDARG